MSGFIAKGGQKTCSSLRTINSFRHCEATGGGRSNLSSAVILAFRVFQNIPSRKARLIFSQ